MLCLREARRGAARSGEDRAGARGGGTEGRGGGTEDSPLQRGQLRSFLGGSHVHHSCRGNHGRWRGLPPARALALLRKGRRAHAEKRDARLSRPPLPLPAPRPPLRNTTAPGLRRPLRPPPRAREHRASRTRLGLCGRRIRLGRLPLLARALRVHGRAALRQASKGSHRRRCPGSAPAVLAPATQKAVWRAPNCWPKFVPLSRRPSQASRLPRPSSSQCRRRRSSTS